MIRWMGAAALVFSFSTVFAGTAGYYRQPAIHGDTIVFVAEGDLWKVPVSGGAAERLTTHDGEETTPRISSDGKTVAFTAEYEGPTEVYTMPIEGGLPTRLTFEGGRPRVTGWTPDGRVLFTTDADSGVPTFQLAVIDPRTLRRERVPLSQAAAGTWDDEGKTFYFVRLPFQGSQTKRYRGGTAQNIWKFDLPARALGADERGGAGEAVPLTSDYAGTSKDPMWWKGRIYFASDRDGIMNIWSMDPSGGDLRQQTRHKDYDIASPALSEGRIVYQQGADIRILDLATGKDRVVPIHLESDLDQTREHWVAKPMEYLTSAHISPKGDRVVLTARGSVFVAPHRQGRLVEVTKKEGVRARQARFMPDGKSVIALTDESGEVEIWNYPANGVGGASRITSGADVLRTETLASPDGAWIAHQDKNYRLWLTDVKTKETKKVAESGIGSFSDLTWSGDSRWLAYVEQADNAARRIVVLRAATGERNALTTDRFDSYSPAWSPDGKWLYMLSDRNIVSAVQSVWGPMEPEPFLDRKTKIYQIALRTDLRSPFAPLDELHPEEPSKEDAKPGDVNKDKTAGETGGAVTGNDAGTGKGKKAASTSGGKQTGSAAATDKDSKGKPAGEPAPPAEVVIDRPGIETRLYEVPVPPGNYGGLSVTDKALFWVSTETGVDRKPALVGASIARENVEVKTLVPDIKDYELSLDNKKLLVRKEDALYIVDAAVADKIDLDKKKVVLDGWALSVIPRQEWREMFTEAWRLERDYFYDRNMHGVDWKAVLDKYLPLVDRVTTRAELSDLMAQMVSELSALHTFVVGGDLRRGTDQVQTASLGAVLERDGAAGGLRVAHIHASDPDMPEKASPLAAPNVSVKEGDLIEQIDGVAAASVPDYRTLLRAKAGRQVLLRVKPGKGGVTRDVIVTPLTAAADRELRYHEWEYTRRLKVEEAGRGKIGYVHLRAMGGEDFSDWARGYYPVFTREGLIVDVRDNRGGNIDSWILGRLLRKVWHYWNDRAGKPPTWNMQYAFRGHIAVLCNERTASDGEIFSEGVKRLGIGKLIGTRTWGGEIWLSMDNVLVDRGIASAAEYGVYGPEGQWIIEGHGVDPDIVVDNLPHATFKGSDAQLDAAIQYLLKEIAEKPVPPLSPPQGPDKSFKPGGRP